MTDGATRAAIYLRISLDRAMDGLAIDRQRQDCEAIVSQRGWTLTETYVDQSISASKRNVTRPAYDRMVADYEAGLLDAIVCYDLDRLTRQPRQLEDWIDRAEQHGLLLTTANGEADLGTDGGRMYARIKAAVARAEVERKGERQSRAQRQRAEQGRPPKGIRPIGYALDGSVIPDEAAVVLGIYQAMDRGTSLRDVCRALNGDTEVARNGTKVPLPPLPKTPRHTHTLDIERNERRRAAGQSEKPVTGPYPWIPTTLLSILRNPRYAGYSVYRKRTGADKAKWSGWRDAIVRDEAGEPIKGMWEPIVPADLWWRVQERLDDPTRKTNRTGSTARTHLGSGLYVCAQCGRPVRTHGARYRCPDAHVLRSQKQVDDYVVRVIRARLARPDIASVMTSTDAARTSAVDDEIADHRAKISRAQSDYDAELIEATDLKRIRDRARAVIEELTAQRLRLTAGDELAAILGGPDPVKLFDKADLATRRRIIDLLAEVALHPGVRGSRTFRPDSVEIRWRTA